MESLAGRLAIAVLAATAAVLLAASSAAALPCNPDTDPDCDPGGGTTVRTVQTDLDVSRTAGTVTTDDGKINCGTTCHADYAFTRTCADFDCTDSGYDEPILSASGGPFGFSPRFSYCAANVAGDACATGATVTDCGFGTCQITIDGDYRATLAWIDTTAPSKATVSGPSTVGPSVRTITASASDNAGVTAMRFVVDGVSQPLDTSAPFQYDAGALAEGGHSIVALARDAANNEGPVSDTFDFTVDKSTSVAITSPGEDGHFQTAPSFTFTKESGASAVCSTLTGASGENSVHSASCDASYTPQPSGDGLYRMRVVVTDAVGNSDDAEREFTIDDSDPNLTVTSPAQNGRLKSPFTPVVSATDGQPGAVAVTCQYGSGAAAACGQKSLPDGAATLTVTATDLAGNTRTVVRSFTVDSTGPAIGFTAGPADGSIVRTTSVTFRWTATDGSQPLAQRCKLDGGALAACSGNGTHVLSNLSAGSHTFTLEATDALGNVRRVERDFFVNLETTTPPTTTTTTTPTTTPIIPPPAQEIINATLSTDYDAFRSYTRYSRLKLKGVPAGAKVKVTCKGKKCPAKRSSKLSKFAKKKLRAGTKLTIRITKPGAVGKQFVIKIRAGKRPTLKISQLT